MLTRHLEAVPADAAYVDLLLAHPEFAPSDASYASWLKFNVNGIERGEQLIRIVEARVGSIRGLRVLDIGAGAGGLSIALHRHGCRVTAIEIDPVRIRWLATRLAAHHADVEVLTRPIEDLGLAPEYSVIFCDAVLEHVRDWKVLVREIVRLKPQVAYLSWPNKFSVLSIVSDPHYSMFGVVFLEGWLRWLQRPYLRARGVKRNAWVTAIPMLSSVTRYIRHRDARVLVERSYPESFAKLDRPETIRFAPARWFVRAATALGLGTSVIRRALASQRKTLELLLVR